MEKKYNIELEKAVKKLSEDYETDRKEDKNDENLKNALSEILKETDNVSALKSMINVLEKKINRLEIIIKDWEELNKEYLSNIYKDFQSWLNSPY